MNTLIGDIDTRLNDLAIEYLRFLTWEKVYRCGKNFQQIIEDEFDGDSEIAYEHFLYKVFNEFRTSIFKQILPVSEWINTKDIELTPKQQTDLLFKIKENVKKHSFEDMKDIIGLLVFSLK